MADSADPLDGWESTEFMTEAHSAKQDIYGQLYFHVRNTLFQFCQKIATLDLDIRLVQMDAEELSKRLSHQNNVRTYDRIEVRSSDFERHRLSGKLIDLHSFPTSQIAHTWVLIKQLGYFLPY